LIDIEPDRGPVRRESVIARVMQARPEAERVLYEEFGLPCYRCEVSLTETVGDGARLYGLDPEAVVARLNACSLWQPPPESSESP
jgi:hybrid cluster-associated redox disulfide protein